MRDFCPTFAVHRLTTWIKQGADLNRLIPALSTYMGFSRLAGAEKYLSFTSERFCGELRKLSPYGSRTHWRDYPQLMEFLAGFSRNRRFSQPHSGQLFGSRGDLAQDDKAEANDTSSLRNQNQVAGRGVQ